MQDRRGSSPISRPTASRRRRARAMPRGPRIVDGNFVRQRSRPKARSLNDEFDQRRHDDSEPVFRYDDEPAEQEGFSPGTPVTHAIHRAGKVVEMSGSGRDLKAVVDFASIGRKTVYAKYLEASEDQLN
jgi:hypothetical protein